MKLLVCTLLLVSQLAHAQGIGDVAPPLTLPTLTGAQAALHPRITLVDFSATWCEPCHEALSALIPLASSLEVDLVIVDVGEPVATVQRFYATQKLPPSARVVVDVDGATATRWGHRRFPTTFLVDRAGVIRFINRGYGSGYAARIEAKTRALLR